MGYFDVGQDPLDELLVDDVMEGFGGSGYDASALMGYDASELSGEDLALLGAMMDDDDDDDDYSDLLGASFFAKLKKYGKKALLPHTMLPKSVQAMVAPHTLITNALKAKRRKKRGTKAMMRAALARKAVPAVPYKPHKGRYWPLGFDSGVTIAAAASAVIESSPQVEFRPERLVVPESIAGSFLIQDLKVGKNSQFISNDAIPAEAFQTNATNVVLRMDSAKISQIISLTVNNISGSPARFFASLMGPAIE